MNDARIEPNTVTTWSSAESIAGRLRSEIVEGKLPPGSQLPTRLELKSRFGTTSVTIQRALDRLMQEEFVYANGRRGTYVAESPPHLSRYALIFPHEPSDAEQWRRFWTALSNEALILQQNGAGLQLPLYHAVNGHTDSEDYSRLVRDVKNHRVAGMIFASPPVDLLNTPLLREPGIPRVAITRQELSDMPTVDPDVQSFVDRALAYLRARGRRRVAVLLSANTAIYAEEMWTQGIRAHGMESRPYWLQSQYLGTPVAAQNCVHLLMNPDQRVRPDALVVTDDNLVEHAMAGLVAAGMRVPADLDVVAHCNFPWPSPSILPAKRLGFDAREVLQSCIASIDRQRQGQSVPSKQRIDAIFEEELRNRHADSGTRGSYSARAMNATRGAQANRMYVVGE